MGRSFADSLPPEILLLICEEFTGEANLICFTQVCRSWRLAAVNTCSLWRDLTINGTDNKPHMKAQCYVERAGTTGLRNLNFDMTIGHIHDSPTRLSADDNKSSTFQQIIHAIDLATQKGTIHKLNYFKYYSSNAWHEHDMSYLIRFLLRLHCQPRFIHIITDDETCDWRYFDAIPLIPIFNPRIREFFIKCRSLARFKFSMEQGAPCASRLSSLSLRDNGRVARVGGTGSNVANVMHGLRRATCVRSRPNNPMCYVSIDPGRGLEVQAHVTTLLSMVSLIPISPRWQNSIIYPTTPRIALIGLRELQINTVHLEILEMLDLPALEALLIGPPLYTWEFRDRETPRIEQTLIRALKRLGRQLKLLDISKSIFGESTLMHELHSLCPNLERLCTGPNSGSHKEHIMPFLERKLQSSRGIQKLKVLDLRVHYALEDTDDIDRFRTMVGEVLI